MSWVQVQPMVGNPRLPTRGRGSSIYQGYRKGKKKKEVRILSFCIIQRSPAHHSHEGWAGTWNAKKGTQATQASGCHMSDGQAHREGRERRRDVGHSCKWGPGGHKV